MLGQSHWLPASPTDGAVHREDGREVDEVGGVGQAHRVRQAVTLVLANDAL